MTIVSLNPIHSVFWLVITFIQSSIFLLSSGYDFIGFILIIIYVGAIAILFLFVIMMLDVFQLSTISKITYLVPLILLIVTTLVLSFNINVDITFSHFIQNWIFEQFTQLEMIGKVFYTDYAVPFILMSIILLVAMIAAILLTLDISIITKHQVLTNQHQRNNSWI